MKNLIAELKKESYKACQDLDGLINDGYCGEIDTVETFELEYTNGGVNYFTIEAELSISYAPFDDEGATDANGSIDETNVLSVLFTDNDGEEFEMSKKSIEANKEDLIELIEKR